MQTELLITRKWKTRTELSTAIFDWSEIFYNRTRRHSSHGNISLAEFERRHQQQPHAACLPQTRSEKQGTHNYDNGRLYRV